MQKTTKATTTTTAKSEIATTTTTKTTTKWKYNYNPCNHPDHLELNKELDGSCHGLSDECQRWWADAPTTSDPPSFLHVGLGLASTQIGRHRPKAADQVRRPSDTGCFDSCLGSPLSLRLVRGLVEEPRG